MFCFNVFPLWLAGPAGPRQMCDGDPVSGTWRFSGAPRWFAPWRPACVSQPHPAGHAQSGRGCRGSQVCSAWYGLPRNPEASGGKSKT